jgi:hypothetical protein
MGWTRGFAVFLTLMDTILSAWRRTVWFESGTSRLVNRLEIRSGRAMSFLLLQFSLMGIYVWSLARCEADVQGKLSTFYQRRAVSLRDVR